MNNGGRVAAAAPRRSLAAPRNSVLTIATRATPAAATGPSRVLQASGTRAQLSLLPRPGSLR